jgi:hypothetical protein
MRNTRKAENWVVEKDLAWNRRLRRRRNSCRTFMNVLNIKVNKVFIFNVALDWIWMFCLLNLLVFPHKRLILPDKWTFEAKAGFLFAVEELSSGIFWSLNGAQVDPFGLSLFSDFWIGLVYSWRKMRVILRNGMVLNLILQFWLLWLFTFLFRYALKFSLLLEALDNLFFGWILILSLLHTVWTWLLEHFCLGTQLIWWLGRNVWSGLG